jgi:hypothetical protein
MADLSRPVTYVGKLEFVQRLVKSAQFRTDPKLAVRELCEAIGELATALMEKDHEEQLAKNPPPS